MRGGRSSEGLGPDVVSRCLKKGGGWARVARRGPQVRGGNDRMPVTRKTATTCGWSPMSSGRTPPMGTRMPDAGRRGHIQPGGAGAIGCGDRRRPTRLFGYPPSRRTPCRGAGQLAGGRVWPLTTLLPSGLPNDGRRCRSEAERQVTSDVGEALRAVAASSGRQSNQALHQPKAPVVRPGRHGGDERRCLRQVVVALAESAVGPSVLRSDNNWLAFAGERRR